MKTIGLIGGMSWESTSSYYRILNERVADRRGGHHSARCLLWSFDFDEIHALQCAGEWATATARMEEAARAVVRGGAECIVICTNTMHKMAEEVERAAGVPLVHIADATAACIRRDGHRVIGLLGTRFTMEEDFIRGRLQERHGLEVLIPEKGDRQLVHDVIFNELCKAQFYPESRQEFARIMNELMHRGAAGIILGCTEIGLLVKPEDCPLPLYDTTVIHAEAAVEFALG